MIVLVAARLVLAVIGTVAFSHRSVDDGYIDRFQAIHDSSGRPYRDFQVEYPPVALVLIEATAGRDREATAIGVLWLSVIADLAAAAAIARTWGRDAAGRYLLLGLPLIAWAYLSMDVVVVALAIGGIACCERRRERTGGVLMALAVLTKLWPVVLLPGLLIAGRKRTLGWCLGSLALGVGLWLSWGGPHGPMQVLTFRGAPGWEVESTIGTGVWIATGDVVRFLKDAPRIGVAPTWATLGLSIALVTLSVAVWRRAGRSRDMWGPPTLAAVCALLFLSPIFSYPYAMWVIPWGAIARPQPRRPWFTLALGVTVLTASLLVALQLVPEHVWLLQTILVARNGLVGLIGITWLVSGPAAASSRALDDDALDVPER